MKRFIRDAAEAGEPFFVWHNTTRMHYRTNLSEEYQGKSGTGNVYADGMMELDDDVGKLLELLDELGIADTGSFCPAIQTSCRTCPCMQATG
jgi:arylsulfatase A-like enzyme